MIEETVLRLAKVMTMISRRKILVLVGFICLTVTILGLLAAYYYVRADHVVYELNDAKTGLRFTATCRFSQFSYANYIVVNAPAPSNREISRNELPYSADSLSQCLNEPYYKVTSLRVSDDYTKLTVVRSDNTTAMEVPLLVKGIEFPGSPWAKK